MLDLRDVISVPGAKLPFECVLDGERLAAPYVIGFDAPVSARGEVANTAGALWVRAGIDAAMECRCDAVPGATTGQSTWTCPSRLVQAEDTDEAEAFCLEGETLDIADLLETVFILNMDTKSLCRDDCKGLCPRCGKDLNEGPCQCRSEIDPRLAVLEQLLDK